MTDRPDWYAQTTIEGKYGAEYVTIAVDATGQLYALLKGKHDGDFVPVRVDSVGQLYTLLMGLYGATNTRVAVDVAGRIISLMKGDDAGTIRTIAVDGDGNLISVMKGDFGGTLKTIAVDDDGVMKAIIFPGAVVHDTGNQNVAAGTFYTLLEVTGTKGVLQGGNVRMFCQPGNPLQTSYLELFIDNVSIGNDSCPLLDLKGHIRGVGWPFSLTLWSVDQENAAWLIIPNIGFSMGFLLRVRNNSAAAADFWWRMSYSVFSG